MKKILISVIVLVLYFNINVYSKVIEEIYAIVNDEIITLSDIKNTEANIIRYLRTKYNGKELKKKIEKMRKKLLDSLIEEKLIYSLAKQKGYNVDNDIKIMIKEIKKQNNITTDEELKKALASQGISYNEWINELKNQRVKQMLIYEEVGSKIKVDNSEIVEYYKKHIKDYTSPLKFKIKAIYLNKKYYLTKESFEKKKQEIDKELRNKTFEEVAKKFTDFPNKEINLGTFKPEELDPAIKKEIINLKTGDISKWIEAENGYYLIKIEKRINPVVKNLKEVNQEIRLKIQQKKQEKKFKEYLKEIKKKSYIKIIKQYG